MYNVYARTLTNIDAGCDDYARALVNTDGECVVIMAQAFMQGV